MFEISKSIVTALTFENILKFKYLSRVCTFFLIDYKESRMFKSLSDTSLGQFFCFSKCVAFTQ